MTDDSKFSTERFEPKKSSWVKTDERFKFYNQKLGYSDVFPNF